jgi:hypothetical protein
MLPLFLPLSSLLLFPLLLLLLLLLLSFLVLSLLQSTPSPFRTRQLQLKPLRSISQNAAQQSYRIQTDMSLRATATPNITITRLLLLRSLPPYFLASLHLFTSLRVSSIRRSVFRIIVGILTNKCFLRKGFYLVIIMGSIWEFGSYATRTISTRNQQNSGLALISQILILLAPICK